MTEARKIHRYFYLGALILFGLALLSLSLQGCQVFEPAGENQESSGTPILEFSPTLRSNIPTQQPEMTGTTPPIAPGGDIADFPPPSIDPATPIPPPMEVITLSDEVQVWVLLGSDTEPPFIGKTPAIHLLFVHPRFSKASLVSIPGDLYVYIPGYTMQRMNTAYAVGGIELVRDTLAYNFGVNPSRFVLAHPGDFQWLVDDINTIDVTVFYPIPQHCGGIRAGLVPMDGTLALCYASYREGMDEVDRMRRQQQLLRIIFRKLTSDGNLVKLPILYASYEGWVKTDFSLTELMSYIPLALRLADPDRIGYYMIGWDQMALWEIPGYSQAQVFLPNQEAVQALFQQAIDHVMQPSPLTNQVQTLEAQLTAAFEQTITAAVTATPSPTTTPTLTPTPTLTTLTPSPSTLTITPTLTLPEYP